MFALGIILSKYWKQLLIVAVVLFILFYIWYRGKKAGESGKPKHIGLTNDFVIGGTMSVDGGKVRRIATLLHDDMDGFNFGHDDQIYNEFAALSDTEFVAVYNDFNNQFFSEGEGTLKEWIISEVYGDWTIIEDIILPKMARLNLN